MIIKMIIAVDKNYGIGYKNKLPWNYLEDLKFFKEQTINNAIVMGTNTYLSINKALPNRTHYVLSNSLSNIKDILIIKDYTLLINKYRNNDNEILFVSGGAQIYKLFENYYDELIISKINDIYECDSYYNIDNIINDYELIQNKTIILNEKITVFFYKKV